MYAGNQSQRMRKRPVLIKEHLSNQPALGTLSTYHPLIIDAHFSILIALLMLGDTHTLLETFVKSAVSLDGADGYPVFSPARSMAQADFNEVLERLCSSWKYGKPAKSYPAQTSSNLGTYPSSPRATSKPQAGPSDNSPSTSAAANPSSSSSLSSSSGPQGAPAASSTPSQASAQQPDKTSASSSFTAMRTLLAPVYAKLAQQRKNGAAKGRGIPLMLLCSPRVDIVLAWLAAVHLPAWEDTADI